MAAEENEEESQKDCKHGDAPVKLRLVPFAASDTSYLPQSCSDAAPAVP